MEKALNDEKLKQKQVEKFKENGFKEVTYFVKI